MNCELNLPNSILIYTGEDDHTTLQKYFDTALKHLAIVSFSVGKYYGYRLQMSERDGGIYRCYRDDIESYVALRADGNYQQVPEEWWMLSVQDFIEKFDSEILGLGIKVDVCVDALLQRR